MQALLDSLQIPHLKRKQNKKDVTEFFSGVCFLPQRILFNQKGGTGSYTVLGN